MSEHILIELAVRRSVSGAHHPSNEYGYDAASGLWKSKDGSLPSAPTTKKNDIETGEDTKGE